MIHPGVVTIFAPSIKKKEREKKRNTINYCSKVLGLSDYILFYFFNKLIHFFNKDTLN